MSRRLSFYVHIPYCVKRCGYCDFNTYTPAELIETGQSQKSETNIHSVSKGYIDLVIREIELAKRTIGSAQVPTI